LAYSSATFVPQSDVFPALHLCCLGLLSFGSRDAGSRAFGRPSGLYRKSALEVAVFLLLVLLNPFGAVVGAVGLHDVKGTLSLSLLVRWSSSRRRNDQEDINSGSGCHPN